MSKELLLGNEAFARGLWEAGCRFVSSYPGTPSSEITKAAGTYPELHAEWAPNEKVAAEAAVGASFAGARAFTAMKHVGFNVGADAWFTASYTGVGGGLVAVVADDPGMQSSQNEQDSRHYAMAAKLPMLEPADSADCLEYTKLAFDLSEQYDAPVLVRSSTRISHARTLAEVSGRAEVPLKPYKKDISKWVMVPQMARARHPLVEKRLLDLAEYAETSGINRIEWGSKKVGIIAAGLAYVYGREALGENASYLKLGMVHPLPEKMIREFAAGVDRLIVLEELDDIIETHCKKLGLAVEGKNLFSFCGEYTPLEIRAKVLGEAEGIDVRVRTTTCFNEADMPGRPPVLCPGCSHRAAFHVMGKMKLTVVGDIGCYTLGAAPPLSSMDFCLCMGAGVSSVHGLALANPELAKTTVGVVGDSTFWHSGMTGLINIVYNQSPATIVILDNDATGMTGHQDHPSTGKTLQGKIVPKISIEAVCRGLGVKRVRVVDPFDMDAFEAALQEELAAPEPSVIIAHRPCALLPESKREAPLVVDAVKCKGCGICMKIGCPAISKDGKKVAIDPAICVGCGLCKRLCKVGAL
jgi:indolepyruvate ferredoxin oxidoreductase alpha subunit